MRDQSDPPLRLTRRGRFVLLLLVAVLGLLLAGVLAQATGGLGGGRTERVSHDTVVVQPGETLWSIAKEITPGRDVRSLVREIEELNGLPSGYVQAGQRLVVPTR